MKTQILSLGKFKIYEEFFASNSPTQSVVVFLHGYPADRGTKNRDLAKIVSSMSACDAFVIHYPGLGNSPGHFSFSQSINAAKEFLFRVQFRKYKNIFLVGHSWGGYVALTLMCSNYLKDQLQGLILLSPFIQIPDGRELTVLVHNVYNETQKNLVPQSKADVENDLQNLSQLANTNEFVSTINSSKLPILYLQAAADTETPLVVAQSFVGRAPEIDFEIFETDHSFTGCREQAAERISEFVRMHINVKQK